MVRASESGFSVARCPWTMEVAVPDDIRHLRHVDNVTISALFNQGRNRFQAGLIEQGGPDGFSEQVIARIEIDFAAELLWTPIVTISGGIGRVGNSSFEVKMWLSSAGRSFATCATTKVWMAHGRSRPISPEGRRTLSRFALPDTFDRAQEGQ
ncbi:MAG: acyl-CoA thioesterase [Sphingobium sp.]